MESHSCTHVLKPTPKPGANQNRNWVQGSGVQAGFTLFEGCGKNTNSQSMLVAVNIEEPSFELTYS